MLRFRGGIDEPDYVGVNLAQRHERPRVGPCSGLAPNPECSQERHPVTLDRSLGIVFRESQIEHVLPIYARESAHARGESVDEPGKLAQMRGVNNVEFLLREIPIQHLSMLPEAAIMGRTGSAESRSRPPARNFSFVA